MENHPFWRENPLYIVIFNSYVKLPEGSSIKPYGPTLPSSTRQAPAGDLCELIVEFPASGVFLPPQWWSIRFLDQEK